MSAAGAPLLPLAGEGGPTKSGRMRELGVTLDAGRRARFGTALIRPSLTRATFSRKRAKEGREAPLHFAPTGWRAGFTSSTPAAPRAW